MFILMHDGHKIEIDLFPKQTIIFDGNVVSKKVITPVNKHIFNINENGEDIQYEVEVKLLITPKKQSVVTKLIFAGMSIPYIINEYKFHWVYQIVRDGTIIYTSGYITKDHTFFIQYCKNGNKIEVLIGDNKKEIVKYDDEIVAQLFVLPTNDLVESLFPTPKEQTVHDFIIKEDGKEIKYKCVIDPNLKCEIRRGGKLVVTHDMSMTEENIKTNIKIIKGLLKAVKVIATG